ncbi:hypothetical protein BKA58DRAFT_178539 [Alternaria rosae]|uniref:uncharacterized protein n=1 Tax=Alternaria rosae TaxID=1187941 RepID=UPI001E8D35DC|nr:uncharacterized protein BKA58DRAFT_178539 [Alternaria rosae]KAH6870526.1 hypothetical protein BKA58DRAFT_178539 [Alternaria rosae]
MKHHENCEGLDPASLSPPRVSLQLSLTDQAPWTRPPHWNTVSSLSPCALFSMPVQPQASKPSRTGPPAQRHSFGISSAGRVAALRQHMSANALEFGAWISSGEMGSITHWKSPAFEPAILNAITPQILMSYQILHGKYPFERKTFVFVQDSGALEVAMVCCHALTTSAHSRPLRITERYLLRAGRPCPAHAPHSKHGTCLYFIDYTLVRMGGTPSSACAAI